MKCLRFYFPLFLCLLLISVSGSAEIDPATIVAGWLFDDGDGDIAADLSGNGHDGEIQGTPKWVDGKFGKALEFDGAKDWVEVPEIGTFEEITACVWAQYTGRVGQFRSQLSIAQRRKLDATTSTVKRTRKMTKLPFQGNWVPQELAIGMAVTDFGWVTLTNWFSLTSL